MSYDYSHGMKDTLQRLYYGGYEILDHLDELDFPFIEVKLREEKTDYVTVIKINKYSGQAYYHSGAPFPVPEDRTIPPTFTEMLRDL